MTTAKNSLYVEWLSGILDTKNPHTRRALDTISKYDGLAYKNDSLTYEYARLWCQLSKCLYDHRHEQLFSEKVNMQFYVPEVKQYTDVYWFEVLRACDMSTEATLNSLIQTLGLLIDTKQQSHAQHVLNLTKEQGESTMLTIKGAIGLCSYVLKTAVIACPFLQNSCPSLLKTLRARYQTLRVIGFWLIGVQAIICKEYHIAANWLSTAEAVCKQHTTTKATELPMSTGKFLVQYALLHVAIESKFHSTALGRLREAKKLATVADTKEVIPSLEILTENHAKGLNAAVPQENSPLLRFTPVLHTELLQKGTDPLVASPFDRLPAS